MPVLTRLAYYGAYEPIWILFCDEDFAPKPFCQKRSKYLQFDILRLFLLKLDNNICLFFFFLLCFVFWGFFWHKRFNITFLITYNNLRKCLVNNIDYNLRSAINSKSMEVTHELKMTFLLVNLSVENQNQSAFLSYRYTWSSQVLWIYPTGVLPSKWCSSESHQ